MVCIAFLGFSGSVFFFSIRRTDTDFFVRMPSYFDVQSKSVVLIDIFCFLRFFDFSGWVSDSFQVPGTRRDDFLCPRRCQKVRGRLELLNGSLRGLEEVWTSTLGSGIFLSSLWPSWVPKRWPRQVWQAPG